MSVARAGIVSTTLAVVAFAMGCQCAPVSADHPERSAVRPAEIESTSLPTPANAIEASTGDLDSPPRAEARAVDAGRWQGRRTHCPRALSDFCHGACPTFATARTQAGGDDAGPYDPNEPDPLCEYRVHVGMCGADSYVRSGDCLAGELLFFDRRGRLIGVSHWSDVVGRVGGGCFGEVPDPCP